MALDISKYNGDFRAFVDFASTAKDGTAIAQLGDATNVAAVSPHATLPRAKGCIKVSVHPTGTLLISAPRTCYN